MNESKEFESLKKIAKLASDFEDVLDNDKEETIHQFMASNPILEIMLDGCVASKIKLSDEYVTDFIVMESSDWREMNARRVGTYFVEIERSNIALFTKSGNPTAELTHAMRQVQDWKLWISENKPFFAKALQRYWFKVNGHDENAEKELNPYYRGFSEEYLVILGRRNTMKVADRLRLEQMNRDLQDIRIITYDTLLDVLVRASQSRFGYYRDF